MYLLGEWLKTIFKDNNVCLVHIEIPSFAIGKKVSCIKGANKQNHFKQNTLSEEKNGTCKDLILAYYKPLIAENVIISLRRQ